MIKPLNLFYSEPESDRWFRFDRYPRNFIRRLIRGKQRPGGVMMVALNLMAGLDRLKIPYRFNDYKYIQNHPEELACIIGKPQLIFEQKWSNPILFGAGIYSHPIECPDLFIKYPLVKRVLVPGEWMLKMFEPYYKNKVTTWPTGIDTQKWEPAEDEKIFDFLIYDKIRWKYDEFKNTLIEPIKVNLKSRKLTYNSIQYGHYEPEELSQKLRSSKAVIFLCEHETQGLAYQQILACNIPILAWDRGGFWQDPYYFPHKVKFEAVSSVPYWDDRCGRKFTEIANFDQVLTEFIQLMRGDKFEPRNYILDNLTLEKCALRYVQIAQKVIDNEL